MLARSAGKDESTLTRLCPRRENPRESGSSSTREEELGEHSEWVLPNASGSIVLASCSGRATVGWGGEVSGGLREDVILASHDSLPMVESSYPEVTFLLLTRAFHSGRKRLPLILLVSN